MRPDEGKIQSKVISRRGAQVQVRYLHIYLHIYLRIYLRIYLQVPSNNDSAWPAQHRAASKPELPTLGT